jgi:hypothetical protein
MKTIQLPTKDRNGVRDGIALLVAGPLRSHMQQHESVAEEMIDLPSDRPAVADVHLLVAVRTRHPPCVRVNLNGFANVFNVHGAGIVARECAA